MPAGKSTLWKVSTDRGTLYVIADDFNQCITVVRAENPQAEIIRVSREQDVIGNASVFTGP